MQTRTARVAHWRWFLNCISQGVVSLAVLSHYSRHRTIPRAAGRYPPSTKWHRITTSVIPVLHSLEQRQHVADRYNFPDAKSGLCDRRLRKFLAEFLCNGPLPDVFPLHALLSLYCVTQKTRGILCCWGREHLGLLFKKRISVLFVGMHIKQEKLWPWRWWS